MPPRLRDSLNAGIVKPLAAIALLTWPVASHAQVDLSRAPEKSISAGVTSISNGVQLVDGRFLFVDRATPAILVADFARNTLVTLGRTGAGPNEYKAPTAAIADGTGGAIVADGALGRALGVNPAGELVGVRFTQLDLGASPLEVRRVNRDGSAYVAKRVTGGTADSLAIVRWRSASTEPAIVAWWPMVPVTLGPPTKGPDGEISQVVHGEYWPRRTNWAALPNESIAIVRPEPFRVDIVRADGSRILGRPVKYTPVLVDAKVKEAYRNQRGPIPDGDFPKTLPRFEGFDDLIASDRNEIWVARLRPPSDLLPIYDIFDSTARYVGTAKLRNGSKVVGFGQGVVYVAREDAEDGLWYLERYRRQ